MEDKAREILSAVEKVEGRSMNHLMYKEVEEKKPLVKSTKKEVKKDKSFVETLGIYLKDADDAHDQELILDLITAITKVERLLKYSREYEKSEYVKKLRGTYIPLLLELAEKLVYNRCTADVKEKIRNAISTGVKAVENIYDKIIEADDLDTLSDIAVLNNNFARDGLLDSDFDIK